MKNYLKDIIDKEGTDFGPCPQCSSKYVYWTNSRDQDVQYQYVQCIDCSLTTFQVETSAFINLPNLDYETTVMKYNAWIKTNPKRYLDESWEDL